MNKYTVRIWLILTLCVGMLLVACQPEATETPPEETEVAEETAPPSEAEAPVETTEPPEIEVEIVAQDPVSTDIRLDPAITDDEDSLLVSGYIYEGLVSLEDEIIIPALAARWTVSEDELDYIFYLRPDLVFHDGTPMDADAVIANFNRWFDPEDPLRGSGSYDAWETIFLGFKGELDEESHPVSFFDGIEKVDDLTVLIHLNRQYPALLLDLTRLSFAIASPTALAADGDAYGTQAGSAIGAGPYYVGGWTEGSIILLPNPNYWGTQPETGLEFPLN